MTKGFMRDWPLVLAATGILSYLALAASPEYGGYAPLAATRPLLYLTYVLASLCLSRWAFSIGGLLALTLVPSGLYALSFALMAGLYPALAVSDILMVWSLQRAVASLIAAIPPIVVGALVGRWRLKPEEGE